VSSRLVATAVAEFTTAPGLPLEHRSS
jgi:hypothetical protein